MGNAAAKEVKSTPLSSEGSIKDSSTIHPALKTSDTFTAKSKGQKWIRKGVVSEEESNTLFSIKNKGMIHSHSMILVGDDEADVVAYVITVKKGMASETCYICKAEPTFDGQQSLDETQLKKAGIETDKILYPFSILKTKRTMSAGTCTYSKITSKADGAAEEDFETEVVYEGKKLSAMGFQALFQEGEDVIAKAATKGMSMTPSVEVTKGVDVCAIILMGYSLAGDANAAGAMAGAGAV